MPAKKITIGSIPGTGHWVVLRSEGEDQYTVRGTALSCGHTTIKSDWALRYNKTASCLTCLQKEKEQAVVDKTVEGFTITGVTNGRSKQGRRIVTLRCDACGSNQERSTAQLAQARLRGHELKCAGCKDAQFTAAIINPLVLTPEQATSALRWAKRGVKSVLGKEEVEQYGDDIASEAIMTVLIKGSDVDIGADGVGKLVFRVAQQLAKRRWNKAEVLIKDPPQNDGDWDDIFDNLSAPAPEPGQSDDLQVLALNSLGPADREFLAHYSEIKLKSKAQKLRWAALVSQAKARLNSLLIEIENQTESKVHSEC